MKKFRLVRDGHDRSLVFLEGFRLIEDALGSNIQFDCLLLSERLSDDARAKALITRLSSAPHRIRCEFGDPEIVEYVSDVETPQGVMALVTRPRWSLQDLIQSRLPLVLLIEGLRDPGNLGTILRSAEALGATGLITAPATVDPFSTKVVRASMGSALRLPILEKVELQRAVAGVRQAGLAVIATSARASRVVTEEDLTRPVAILVGSEAVGLSKEALAQADSCVRIPLIRSVESLNAAIATTILLYEAARQRRF